MARVAEEANQPTSPSSWIKHCRLEAGWIWQDEATKKACKITTFPEVWAVFSCQKCVALTSLKIGFVLLFLFWQLVFQEDLSDFYDQICIIGNVMQDISAYVASILPTLCKNTIPNCCTPLTLICRAAQELGGFSRLLLKPFPDTKTCENWAWRTQVVTVIQQLN